MFIIVKKTGDKEMMTKLLPIAFDNEVENGFEFSFNKSIPADVRWASANALEQLRKNLFIESEAAREALIHDLVGQASDIYDKHQLKERIKQNPRVFEHFVVVLKDLLECNLSLRYGVIKLTSKIQERMAS